MMKKIISLSLCLLMLLSVFVGCAKEKDENDYGAYVSMYLTDPIYNFDPAMAYGNDSALKVISLLFDNLFILNDDGKIENSLAKKYTIDKEENQMVITLNTTSWSNGSVVTAEDVVFSWRRILDNSNSFGAAALLYDIKNARAAKENKDGITIDDVGISARGDQVIIDFEENVDYDQFLLNLTSYALAPLYENCVNRTYDSLDWAKKPSLIVTSGPFKLREVSYTETDRRLVLERNNYYYRNPDLDPIDESVTPYRLVIDYTMTDAEIMQAYSEGKLFFVGDIPFSVRKDWKDEAEVTDALSTHSYLLNQNALIQYYTEDGFAKLTTDEYKAGDGEKIFAITEVRQAMSEAINREAIAEKVVFAKAATALVPHGVYNEAKESGLFGSVTTFREKGKDVLKTTASDADVAAAKAKIEAKIDPSKFMFAITVPAYDDVQLAIATEVQKAWSALGFHVAIKAVDVVDNTDRDKTTGPISGVKDDIYHEQYLATDYDVIAIDYVAYSADPFSVLAPFAQGFTGEASGGNTATAAPVHATGYKNDAYTKLIEEAYAASGKDRANKLHTAEALLMADLPIIPIVYNEDATLAHKDISKYEFTYYNTPIFTKMKLKNYTDHIPADAE